MKSSKKSFFGQNGTVFMPDRQLDKVIRLMTYHLKIAQHTSQKIVATH